MKSERRLTSSGRLFIGRDQIYGGDHGEDREGDNWNDGEEEEFSMENVSDEITLLAAHAYLKKKGRLPWVNKEERRKQSNNQITSGSGGRFWHNPSDLVEENSVPGSSDDLAVEWRGGYGKTYFGAPDPLTYSTRPKSAMSSKFADPAWKEKWYAARWGEGYVSRKREKRVVKKVEELSMDVLESDVLAGMGDEEIMEAVRMYVRANRKRAESRRRKKRGEEGGGQEEAAMERESNGGESEEGAPNSTNSAKSEDHGLKRLGAKKPGNAKLAYETRRSNLAAQKTKQPRGRPKKFPHIDEVISEASKKKVLWRIEGRSISAKAAKVRVEQALSEERPVEARDIQQILKAQRLAGRKQLLLEVARVRFGMIGKCVEIDGGKLEFITNISVQNLGELLLDRIENDDDDDDSAGSGKGARQPI
ncbi:hypothetical protein TrRE_jg8743 [Triparma retinervis]|uniref:Uncharacterized protein n=1 Tax=Triparma retinervis TaxID=2557542 RepID=A0A9W7A5Q1_9STRA|nr:hypothetical protein TrRE_jg8743 [Triparma retinervis]